MKNTLVYFYGSLFLLASCSTYKKLTPTDNGKININYVQVNDVYEIAPLGGGKEGGMARVATIKQKYLRQNPNTFLVMAGDFLSPSVYNSLKYEGKAIRGKQMVEAMNAAGMDLVVFGNHEFDIKEAELQERLNESTFQWISSNSFHNQNGNISPFYKTGPDGKKIPIPATYIQTLKDVDGTVARVGYIGLNIPFTKTDYVSYKDVMTVAKDLYAALKDSVDAVVAITHQLIQDDIKLAEALPGLAVILGGHEHDQRLKKIGKVFITKAMANAKTAFIVQLNINKKRKKLSVDQHVETLNENVAVDNTTNAVVQKWMSIAEKSYASIGFDAKKIVLSTGEPLDGRESEIRSHPTNLSRLIISSLSAASPTSEVVLVNAGSIRVDDILQMPVTQYDIIRTLPFGGGIREIEMKGSLLTKIVDAGKKNKGIGGYLMYNEDLSWDETISTWKLKGQPIDPQRIYRVAVTDFLLTGGEANLDFLKNGNPEIVKVDDEKSRPAEKADIRLAIINYLQKK